MRYQHYLFSNLKTDIHLGIISSRDKQDVLKRAEERFQFKPEERDDIVVTICSEGPDYDIMEHAKDRLLDNHVRYTQQSIQMLLHEHQHPIFRQEIVREYGHGIPSRMTIATLAAGNPMVEVGAGTGYWAKLISQRNKAMIYPTDELGNGEVNEWFQQIGKHHPVEKLDGVEAVRKYPNCDVLMVWPTQRNDVAAHAAAEMQVDRKLFVVHHGLGGITGTARLFHVLRTDFEQVDEITLPRYPWLNDRFLVYKKVR